jgi:hypothetical protein
LFDPDGLTGEHPIEIDLGAIKQRAKPIRSSIVGTIRHHMNAHWHKGKAFTIEINACACR